MTTVLEALPQESSSAYTVEQRVILTNISWKTYENLLEDLSNSSASLLTFDKGCLEIISPTPAHESANRALADLVLTVTEVWGIEVYNLGSTTFRREERQRGFEPDTCFYIQHLSDVADKTEIDLARDPAPDLVIEIDHTHPSLDKMPVFAALGVPEIWRYSPRQRSLTLLILQNGQYQEVAVSATLPLITAEVVEELMQQFRPGQRLRWLNAVRDWARQAATPSE